MKFEYKLVSPVSFSFRREKQLNELGSEGWELILWNSWGEKMIFKRKK